MADPPRWQHCALRAFGDQRIVFTPYTVDGGAEVALVPQGVPSAGPVAWGILPTWATNGTVFLTGGAALSHGTLLALAGSAATPIPAPPAVRPPSLADPACRR